jgi:hypothetical protein
MLRLEIAWILWIEIVKIGDIKTHLYKILNNLKLDENTKYFKFEVLKVGIGMQMIWYSTFFEKSIPIFHTSFCFVHVKFWFDCVFNRKLRNKKF